MVKATRSPVSTGRRLRHPVSDSRSLAETVDEISHGRYVLGIGAGNTDDADYAAFGVAADPRYSRFAEAIAIIHGLLKYGEVDIDGEYYSARRSEMVLRGPRPQGPPINIAAGGPRMLELAARYGDAWNWWAWDESLDQIEARLRPLIDTLDRACELEGRDPASIERTLDLYTVISEGFSAEGCGMATPVAGSSEEIAAFIRALGELGFEEVRCDLHPKTVEAAEAMHPVVELVHGG